MSEEFEKRAREVLDEGVARLDGRTRSRLTQARHAALAQLENPARQWWRLYLPLGGATAAAVLAVMLWSGGRSGEEGSPTDGATLALNGNGGAFEDIDLLADGDAPDFLSEGDDLEFYEWAAGEIES
jgi:hypothetical protein